jgi:hypothetical protein
VHFRRAQWAKQKRRQAAALESGVKPPRWKAASSRRTPNKKSAATFIAAPSVDLS